MDGHTSIPQGDETEQRSDTLLPPFLARLLPKGPRRPIRVEQQGFFRDKIVYIDRAEAIAKLRKEGLAPPLPERAKKP
jgi:hypothetical protein